MYAVRNVFEIGMRGGTSGLTYQTDFGHMRPGLNTGIDVAYIYQSPYHVGLRMGIGAEWSQSVFDARSYHDKYSCIDVEKDLMQVEYTMARWTERHHQLYASVPLQMAFYKEGWRLYVGPKVMLPLFFSYTGRATNAELTCLYPVYKSHITEALALSAGTIHKHTQRGVISERPAIWYGLSLETGYAFRISNRQKLVVGIYADYMLNQYSASSTDNLSALQITDTADGVPVARVLTSALEANHHITNHQVVHGYGYFAVGVKISWQIHGPQRVNKRYFGCFTCSDTDDY